MFSKLGLSPAVYSPLARMGYDQPTPIQAKAIPVVLSGVDLLARAQTGTGKTAAFGLPIIERLIARPTGARSVAPRALVLVPTRELAVQVHRSLSTYGAPGRIRATAIFGGVGMGAQVQALRNGTDIVVATPGRLLDHVQRRSVDLSGIQVLTLDEADRMLDMGFLPAIRRVCAACPRTRQTLLFSATLSDAVVRLSAEFTREPARVDVSDRQVVAPTVTHQIHDVALDHKREVLAHVLTQHGGQQALVFCRTKRGANRVGEYLERRRVNVGVIHGNKSQGARTHALDGFKAGRVQVLVATDIAARGLDIVQLPLVINFDLPLVAEDYIHRVGRTGRAGHSGRAVSLVTKSDSGLLRDIQRLLPATLERVPVAGLDVTTLRSVAEPQRQAPGRSHRMQAPASRGRRFPARRGDQQARSHAAPARRATSSGHPRPSVA